MGKSHYLSCLLVATSLVSPGAAFAQVAEQTTAPTTDTDHEGEGEIVVTGSRIRTNGNESPTPLTVVTTEQLQATTPTNIPDALRRLPVFGNSQGAQTIGGAARNAVGNFLNLRSFGSIRTLVLMDGRRVTPTSSEGTVDTNSLPQMLIQRVDVVTGGASAVYGSDAVTGVVNFVLDKRYDGVKLLAQKGISQRGDAPSVRLGIAAGSDVLGDRGHIEFSYEHFDQAGITDKFKRRNGALVYSETGAGAKANPVTGAPANPFRLVANSRDSTKAFGGLIRTGLFADKQFVSPGVLAPFVHGTPSGTAGVEVGGDGTYTYLSSLTASLKTDQAFTRFDYDLGGDVEFYAQGSYARSENFNTFAPFTINNFTISSANPFLPASVRSALAAANQPTFTFGRVFKDAALNQLAAKTQTIDAKIGLQGKLFGTLNWDLYYTYGRSQLNMTTVNNTDNGRLAASLDSVLNNGQIVCRATVTNPTAYPGCVPLNPFGTDASVTGPSLAWSRRDTHFELVNRMDDFGGTLGGSLFDTWAGPVKFAVSGEYRRLKLANVSDAQPSERANCQGVLYNCVPVSATSAGSARWMLGVLANARAHQSITEGALEVSVPLLRDSWAGKSLDVNGAVRYASYSVSGKATTWKLGADWHVTDDLSFRATRSRDIRAPTLYDLFGPVSTLVTQFNDSHTSTANLVPLQTQGNIDLVPEVAQTYTIGGVYRPSWLPRFSIAVDYYNIRIANAIQNVTAASSTTQVQCELSNGTSPLCALFARPLPFSDRSPANFPTQIFSQNLNVAVARTHGIDVDINYSVPIASDNLSLRALVAYQPVLSIQNFPGAPVINYAGAGTQGATSTGSAVWNATMFASYDAGNIRFDVQERWRSSLRQNGDRSIVYLDPKVPAAAFTDLTVTFKPEGTPFQMFVTVQNLFDKAPPVYVTNSGVGFSFPAVNGDDVVGRFFTAGVRLNF